MSMRDYAVDEYGMALNDEQIKMLAKRFIDDKEWIEDNWEDADTWEYADYLDDIIDSYGEFRGEANPVLEDGSSDWRVNVLERDDIFYIPLKKWATLFKAAYENLDEAKAEIAKRINNAFPVEIHHIVGTYFG